MGINQYIFFVFTISIHFVFIFTKTHWEGITKIIKNSQIGASSASEGFAPSECRLNNPSKCWKPSLKDQKLNNSWIRIDLKEKKMITKIRLQGTPGNTSYCKSIWIDYSNDGTSWICHNSHCGEIKCCYDQSEQNIFGVDDDDIKNIDKFSEIPIWPPIHARFIRIRPNEYHKEIALRFDFFGRLDQKLECARVVRFGDLSNEERSEALKKIKHASINTRIIQVDCRAVIRRALDTARMSYVGYVSLQIIT